VYPAGAPGGPFIRGESKGFDKVYYESVGSFVRAYCLVPSADSGIDVLNSVMLVSLGNNGGGGFAFGHDVGVGGTCVDDETGRRGWHVVTWGPDGNPDDEVAFTALVP
jgi:hypothetical protein